MSIDPLSANLDQLTNEQAVCDTVLAVMALGEGHGLAVATPGPIWADEQIIIYAHDDGCIVRLRDEHIVVENDDGIRNHVGVTIPLSRVQDLRDAIDAAVALVEERRARRINQKPML